VAGPRCAAVRLGVKRSTLQFRMQKLGISARALELPGGSLSPVAIGDPPPARSGALPSVRSPPSPCQETGVLPSPGHWHLGTSPRPAPPRPASRLPQPQVARHELRLHRRARGVHCLWVADVLTVLDAERTLLAAQDLPADSETLPATALVAVYKALGGGWDIAPEQAYSKAP
jgi:hypothetical protein